MTALLIATRNPHKVQEIRDILGEVFAYRSLLDFPDAPEIVEDATTFAGNATRKAVGLARWLAARPLPPGQCLILADDSGLEVDALGGAPGVHSARFAALDKGTPSNSDPAKNNAKLLRLLEAVPLQKRSARFRCAVALTPVCPLPTERASPVCYGDEFETATEIFEGTCEGRIGFGPKGQGGFGYDPLFIPSGYDLTFGELSPEVKNRLSHRARALAALKQRLHSPRES